MENQRHGFPTVPGDRTEHVSDQRDTVLGIGKRGNRQIGSFGLSAVGCVFIILGFLQ